MIVVAMDVSAEPAAGVDAQLAERARAEGVKPTGEGGLLARLVEARPVQVEVPRDRESSFEPVIVAQRQRGLSGIDDLVVSLSAKRLTHGEISAQLGEIYGAEVSKQTISAFTGRVMEGMGSRQSRTPDVVYPAIMNLDPTGTGRQRWSNRWHAARNAFEIMCDGRCPPHGSNTPTRSSYAANLTDPTGRVPNLIEC